MINTTQKSMISKQTAQEIYETALQKAYDFDENGEGNSDEIIDLLEKAAAEDHADALYALGNLYVHGKYVQKDIDKAISYFKKGADLYHPEAVYSLGVAYSHGDGLPQDDALAFDYFFKAALLGDVDALEWIVWCLYHGQGVEEDMRLYELAAQVLDFKRPE